MAERRRRPRARKRLGCEIRANSRRFFGMVLNLSLEGAFIQTGARLAPGTRVELTLGAQNERIRFDLRGRVVRLVQAPAQLGSPARSGIGVQLIDPPAAYRDFVSRLVSGAGLPLPEAQPIEPEGAFEFRVEMQALGGGERRTLLVSCKSEVEASELAATELDEGWKVLSVRRV